MYLAPNLLGRRSVALGAVRQLRGPQSCLACEDDKVDTDRVSWNIARLCTVPSNGGLNDCRDGYGHAQQIPMTRQRRQDWQLERSRICSTRDTQRSGGEHVGL